MTSFFSYPLFKYLKRALGLANMEVTIEKGYNSTGADIPPLPLTKLSAISGHSTLVIQTGIVNSILTSLRALFKYLVNKKLKKIFI